MKRQRKRVPIQAPNKFEHNKGFAAEKRRGQHHLSQRSETEAEVFDSSLQCGTDPGDDVDRVAKERARNEVESSEGLVHVTGERNIREKLRRYKVEQLIRGRGRERGRSY